MHNRLLGSLSLLSLVLTAIWLGLLISVTASTGTVETFEQALAYAAQPGAMYFIMYLNAALIVLAVTSLFAVLHATYRLRSPAWSFIGLVFVPVYSALNLVVYLSQVTVVPRLLELMEQPDFQPAAAALLSQSLQMWPDSSIAILNTLAYAVLAIPSIIYGFLLWGQRRGLRIAGALLVCNGIACILGFAGVVLDNPWLEWGTVIGGVLFLAALVPMSFTFLSRTWGR